MIDPIRPNAPKCIPLEADQGAKWSVILAFYDPDSEGNPDLGSPQDLTGYTWQGQVRQDFSKTAPVTVAFTIAAGDAPNKIVLSLTADQLNFSGDYVYELKGTIGGEARSFAKHTFKVWPTAIRS